MPAGTVARLLDRAVGAVRGARLVSHPPIAVALGPSGRGVRHGKDPARVVELARDGDWDIGFSVKPNADRIVRLMRKYADQPMDFADACLVAMTEQVTDCLVLTLDRQDFSAYCRQERALVPFIAPEI